jgi:cell wall-associated NlpC family hydrolase
MSTTLSIREIYDAARSAGFTPHQAVTWTAIAMAESGGRTGALNSKGEYSVGLWQVNVNADPSRATKWGNLNDPEANARAAYAISLHGRDMRPWTTTHDRNKGSRADYRTYLDKVESEIGVAGDPRGVHGYGSKMLKPLTESQYDKIDTGRALSDTATIDGTAGGAGASASQQLVNGSVAGTQAAPARTTTVAKDTDNDGLTDEFERLAGTDPTKADTDGDGLTDGYEAVTSHTDPLSADTDGDKITDTAEIAQGTDPGTVPGRAYVVGEGLLAENIRGGAKDTDGDGLSDHTEQLVGTDPTKADTDGDGLSDSAEASLGTNPTLADSDADGITDGMEVQHGSDPLGPSGGPFDHTPTPAWTLQGAAQARADAAAAATAQQAAARQTAAAQTDQLTSTSAASTPSDTSSRTADDKLSIFLSSAKHQVGDRYVYGAPRTPTAKDPKTFDCSSFTQWAARQAGVKLDSTAEYQYMQLKHSNHLIPVEQALKTKGALLFYFSREPRGGLPAGQAHVAISLGDGRTVEAKGTRYGVGEWSAKHRFNYAATIPGISDEKGLKAHRDAVAVRSGADDPAAGVSTAADKAAAGSGAGVYGSTGSVDGSDSAGAAKSATSTDRMAGATGTNGANGNNVANGTNGANGTNVANGTNGVGSLNGGNGQASTAAAYQIDLGQPVARLPGAGEVDVDSDHDGLTDAFEKLAGTDPGKADSDGDGLSDGYEALVSHTDPLAADTDSDGVSDAQELSLGTDAGRLPGVAGVIGSGRYAENVRKGFIDTDGDGLTDNTEKLAGTNPKSADTDGDGLTDSMEASLGTDPLKSDTDGDGVSDGAEVQFHSNPLDAASTLGPAGAPPAGTQPAGTQPAGTQPAGTQPAGTQPAGIGDGLGTTSGSVQSAAIGGDLGQGLGEAAGSAVTGGGIGTDPLGGDALGSPQGNAAEALDLG